MPTREELKAQFITGYKITQSDYSNWLDSIYFKNESVSSSNYSTTASSADYVLWNNIINKPTQFTPESHNQSIASIDGLQSILDSKQVSGNYSVTGHIHTIDNITNLQTQLDSKQVSGSYITQDILSSYTLTGHNHNDLYISKSSSGDFAQFIHNHSVSAIQNLQTQLDSKQVSGDYLLSTGDTMTGNLDIGNKNISNITKMSFATSGDGTLSEGDIAWNPHFHCLEYKANSEVTIQVGQERTIYCLNTTGFNIPNGTLVVVNGAGVGINRDLPTITPAIATQESKSYVVGMTTQAISNGAEGYVTISGLVNDIDTRTDSEGNTVPVAGCLIYLSKSVTGGWTINETSAPNHNVVVGRVISKNNNGSILINVNIGHEINELHDVLITNPQNNQVLTYSAVSGLWYNSSVSGSSNTLHTHAISSIDNLQYQLDSKQASGNYITSNILSGYSVTGHNHIISDIINLQNQLDSKQASGSYATSNHIHNLQQITGATSGDIPRFEDINITGLTGNIIGTSESIETSIKALDTALTTVEYKVSREPITTWTYTGTYTDLWILNGTSMLFSEPNGGTNSSIEFQIDNVANLTQLHFHYRYYSTDAAPTQHTTDWQIYSVTGATWVSLGHTTSLNTLLLTLAVIPIENGYQYITADANKRVRLRFLHTSQNNSLHRLQVDHVIASQGPTIAGNVYSHTGLADRDYPDQHPISSIIDLQTQLDSKQVSGSYAASAHNHTVSNISDFPSFKTINSTAITGTGNITISNIITASTEPATPATNDLWIDTNISTNPFIGSPIDWSNPVSVTDTANLNFGKHHVVTVTAADKTMTLPAVSGNGGKMLSIEIASTTTKLITIDGNASETIDGATTRIMWALETCLLLCNGTTWTKIAGKSIPLTAVIRRNGNQTITNTVETVIQYNQLLSESVAGLTNVSSTYRINILRPCIAHINLATYFEGTAANTMQNTSAASRIYRETTNMAGIDGSGFSWTNAAFNALLTTQFSCTAGQYIQGRIQFWGSADRTLGPYDSMNRLEFIEVPQW